MSTTAVWKERTSISLTISVDNPFSEIFVIDGNYRLASRGIGDLTAEVVPGIYKIKVRVGRQETETIGLFNEDTTLHLQAEKTATPIPLWNTAETHEYQIDAAQMETQSVHVRLGQGAQIFLMARQYSVGGAAAPKVNPGASLSLHRTDGELLIDYGESGVSDLGLDPWSACTVELDPGAYSLCCRVDDDTFVEQTIYASRGWQTRLFLLKRMVQAVVDDVLESPEILRQQTLAMLGDMAVAMAELGRKFDTTDTMLAEVDVVRVALSDDRAVFSKRISDLLTDMLHGKFENPILGIYGAHLMLMARGYSGHSEHTSGVSLNPLLYQWAHDDNLFTEVIGNLRSLLGNAHPDVEALSLKCIEAEMRATAPFRIPPMLRRSWSLLVEASNARPDLLPIDTWRNIAAMVPVGPFLAWKRIRDEVTSDMDILSDVGSSEPSSITWSDTEKGPFYAEASQELYFVTPQGDSPHPRARRDEDVSPPASPKALDPLRAMDAAVPKAIRDQFQSDHARSELSMKLDVPRAAIDRIIDSES